MPASRITVTALALLVASSAFAQQSIDQILQGLHPVCEKAIDRDVLRDLVKSSTQPVSPAHVCDCASKRMLSDPVLARIAPLTMAERKALPKVREMSQYLAATYYGYSQVCFGEAVLASAQHIDLGP
jgi:hypothetical protein